MVEGLVTAKMELAANSITTAVLAKFWTWESKLHGPKFVPGNSAGAASSRVVNSVKNNVAS